MTDKSVGWHDVGHGFSIQKLKTTYNLRNDRTGEVVRPSGPAGRDNLMMALHYDKVPNYVFYCFPSEQTDHVPEEDVY